MKREDRPIRLNELSSMYVCTIDVWIKYWRKSILPSSIAFYVEFFYVR